jgi:hypothetical protein
MFPAINCSRIFLKCSNILAAKIASASLPFFFCAGSFECSDSLTSQAQVKKAAFKVGTALSTFRDVIGSTAP